MRQKHTQFEATPNGLVATKAILIYTAEAVPARSGYGAAVKPSTAFASLHDIEIDEDGKPTICAGTSLTHAHLRKWTEALGRSTGPEFIPHNVLVAHQDLVVWWTPATIRPAYFALTETEGLQTLGKRTIVDVPYPPHLFIATRSSLGVYALPKDERPTPATEVLHSPILNIFIEGKLCWGDIAMPKAPTIGAIPEYERAVFDSWSTHPNFGQQATVSGTGGLTAMWDDLATRGARKFPVKRLKPFSRRGAPQRGKGDQQRITVGDLIAESSLR